jgi:DHA1 family bicyclomycin/chloramphenicol resistance-like MFS transporter
MRPAPNSRAFIWLLGLLSSLPTFGIDIILPTLPMTGAALGAPPSDIGLAMSVYLLGIGFAFPLGGPLSDRIGRRPVVLIGCALLILGSIGCLLAQSLPQLLVFRTLQGIGAAGPWLGAITIVRDLFDGEEVRARMSFVVFAVNVVPMIAPTIGAALMSLGGWRAIYWVPIIGGSVLFAIMLRVDETARIDPRARGGGLSVARDYLTVLTNPTCLGNAICNAAGVGAVFAYITGSSLFLIDAIGLTPQQYGLVFGATSLSVMAGSLLNQRLARGGVGAGRLIGIGLALSTALAVSLLVMALDGGRSIGLVVLVMTGTALSFALISPNATSEALQPVPDIAGLASAVVMSMQMLGGAISSWLVALLFDGRSALSMAITLLLCWLIATTAFIALARARSAAAGALKPIPVSTIP